MTPNHVKQKLRAGTPSIGSWLNLGSPISETLAPLGFDWLCVDMEHGQIDHCTSTGAARRRKLLGIVNDLRFMTAAAKAARDAIKA